MKCLLLIQLLMLLAACKPLEPTAAQAGQAQAQIAVLLEEVDKSLSVAELDLDGQCLKAA